MTTTIRLILPLKQRFIKESISQLEKSFQYHSHVSIRFPVKVGLSKYVLAIPDSLKLDLGEHSLMAKVLSLSIGPDSFYFTEKVFQRPATVSVTRDELIIRLAIRQQINIKPATCLFGIVDIGRIEYRKLILSNTGNVPLLIERVSSSDGQFRPESENAFPLVIAPGGSEEIAVTFTPTRSGPQKATLTVHPNIVDMPEIQIELSGTGREAGPFADIPNLLLVANRNPRSLELHRKTCSFAARIAAKNRLLIYGTPEQIEALYGRGEVPEDVFDTYRRQGYDGCFYCLRSRHWK